MALASTLVQQGWPVGRALERAFLQVLLTCWQGLRLSCGKWCVGFDSLRPRGRGLLVHGYKTTQTWKLAGHEPTSWVCHGQLQGLRDAVGSYFT